MNLISADAISKTYDSERWLFKNLTLGIAEGEKVALVGVNGTGKSTLLKILAGQLPPDSGNVSVRRGITAAYLDQNPVFDQSQTVWQAMFGQSSDQLAAIYDYELALENQDDAQMQRALARLDALDAWALEYKIREVLGKLGIHHVNQPVRTLSGGQRKRVALARMLLQEPDVMILDEPTNHLDIDTIEWLEGQLSAKNCTLLLVTHDRYFLDRVTNVIVELDGGQLFRYQGNYAYFLEKKDERNQQQATETDRARNLMRRELEWIRRQPKARGTKAKYRVDAFEDIKEKAQGKTADKSMEINVSMARLGNKILELNALEKSYGEKQILHNFSYVFRRGERLGIVGANGAGKTTFLDIITGKTQPDGGTLEVGETIRMGYYTQQELNLPNDVRVIDTVKAVAEVVQTGSGDVLSASQLLTLFQFPPRMQYTPVGKLSGGEKRRLQLLHVLIQNPNFLILDEPTNDLDIVTLNILEEYLDTFKGCLIVVSHDRYFMDRLTDHLFIFEGNAQIRDFPGNYSDYKVYLEEQAQARTAEKAEAAPKKAAAAPAPPKATTEGKRKPSFKEKHEYEQLEADIARLESEKAELTDKLNSGGNNHQQLTEWSERIGKIDEEINRKTDRWITLSELM